MKYCYSLLIIVMLWASIARAYPVTVESCGQPVTFYGVPHRAVFHDVNMAEMAFALHLQPYMRGLTGITGWNKETVEFQHERQNQPELAPRYPTLEQLMAAKADVFVAGWNYGMRVGGDVTPETLAAQNIPSLVLTESCARAGGPRSPITLEALLYHDERRLGVVFGREQEANALIKGWQARVETVEKHVAGREAVRVFLYDSGAGTPFTAGHDALVSELIRLAGGRNIFDNLPFNWGTASWEAAALRKPESFIIVDYGNGIKNSINILRHQPLLEMNEALQKQKILILRYDEVTPSPKNIEAIETLARFLHPDAGW